MHDARHSPFPSRSVGPLIGISLLCVMVGLPRAAGITPTLPFHEDFEPSPEHWDWQAEWLACDTYGGDPCGGVDLASCFPEPDAGTGTGGTGGSTSTSECTSDSSCSSRQVCRDGRCVSVQCTSDSHCGSCSRCSSNVCRSCGSGPYGCYC